MPIKDKVTRSEIYGFFEEEYYERQLLITFSPTAALVAIDIDASHDSPLNINLTAIPIITKHIKIRNLSGTIVIDFLSLVSRQQREKVVFALRNCCRDDEFITRVSSKSGLVEINRIRKGKATHEYDKSKLAALALSLELIPRLFSHYNRDIKVIAHPEINNLIKNKNNSYDRRIEFEDDYNRNYFDFDIY